jgi:hypothetical protein
MLTVLLRPVLSTVPMVLFQAAMAGSGKTLLAKAMCAVGSTDANLDSLPTSEEELQKVLISQLIEGRKVTVFDNINVLNSDALCAMSTTPYYSGRVLGSSRMIKLKNIQTVLFTGNNVRVCNDLSRRVLRCCLAPGEANPEDREFDFDLLKEVRSERIEIISALLSLVYTALNSPVKAPSVGSFEDWGAVVGKTLNFCIAKQRQCAWDDVLPIDDPLLSLKENREQDPQRERRMIFVNSTYALLGKRPFAVQDLTRLLNNYHCSCDICEDDASHIEDLQEVCMEVGSESARDIKTRMLSAWIDRLVGQPIGELAVVRAEKKNSTGRKQWQVLPIEDVTTADGIILTELKANA